MDLKRPQPIAGFDCVEFQHRAAQEIYGETKNMTEEEELAYWKAISRRLAARRRRQARKAQTLAPTGKQPSQS
jgi:hypothetical protein